MYVCCLMKPKQRLSDYIMYSAAKRAFGEYGKLYIIYIMRLFDNKKHAPKNRSPIPPGRPVPYSFSQKKCRAVYTTARHQFSVQDFYFFILVTFFILFNPVPANFVKFLTPFSKSLSSPATVSTGSTFEQQYGHFVAALLIVD